MGLFPPKLFTILVYLFFFFFGLSAVSQADKLKTFTGKYDFSFNDSELFTFTGKAHFSSDGILQVTPDSSNVAPDFPRTNNSGRMVFHNKFKLLDDNSNTSRVSSFNSSFLINIFPDSEDMSKRGGLAFIVVPNSNVPDNSYGEYLGLTNSSIDGNTSNKFVAIEFDTGKQSYDPDDNHIGLNINSVRSVETVSLSNHNIDPASLNSGRRFYNIWINYDGVNKSIQVYLAEQSNKDGPTPMIPSTPLLKSPLDLSDIVDQYSYFGFSASTGNVTQLNCVLRWNLTVEYFPEKEGPWLKIGLGVGIPVAVVMMVAICLYWLRRRKTRRGYESNVALVSNLPGMVKEFGYRELKKATDNFSDKKKLGEGGYGVVYRGFIQRENLEVAVKLFSRESLKGAEDFIAELAIINRLRHKHLVPLLGWSHKNGKLLLVYEYMPNGSLDKHLFRNPENKPLSWTFRKKIALGLASALHYLHNEFDQMVVHRDLKASNIMLDSEFNARLGDFGLARAIDNERTSYVEAEGVHGTMGYVAPECFHTGKATQQSDIFGFGAVLLELVCGMKPGTKVGRYQMLVDWVWSLYREGRLLDAVDEKLIGEFGAEEAERLLLLGLVCMHPIANERPKTETIVQIIKGSVPVPRVPHFKPAFVWPAMMVDEDCSHTVSINFGSEMDSG